MSDYKLPIITGTALSVGDILRWDGSNWVNYADSSYVHEADSPSFGTVNITDEIDGYKVDGVSFLRCPGTNNTFLGKTIGAALTTGWGNTCVGVDCGDAITFATENVCIGLNAGRLLDEGIRNTIIGTYAGYDLTSGGENVCLGMAAGYELTTGNYNMFIGSFAGQNCNSDFNICIGRGAGTAFTTGGSNMLIGPSAGGQIATTSANNVAIGTNALSGVAGNATHLNVAIGGSALFGITTGANNVAIGGSALLGITTGYDNVAIGVNAGSGNTIGARNTYVGANAGDGAHTHNYSIALGFKTQSTAVSQFVVGSVEAPILNMFVGGGVVSVSPQDLTFNATGGSGTNIAAGDLLIAGGKSTGNAAPGKIILQTATAGASGTTLQTLSTRVTVEKDKATFEGSLMMKEKAAAEADVAGNGQLWVKNTDPCELWYTDDAGNDLQCAPQDLRVSASPTFAGLTKIGDAANHSSISSTGVFTLHGNARVTRHYYLRAAAFTKKATSTPTISWIDDFETADFATSPGAQEEIFYTMNVPYRFATGTVINITPIWVYDDAAADADKFVRWGCDCTPVADGDTVSGATTATIYKDTAGLNVNTGKRTDTTLTTGIINAVAHNQISLRFYRDYANDDYGYDARLIGVHVTFTMDKLGLAP